MCAVRAASLLWRLVDLDVLDDQIGYVKALSVGVGLGVLEESKEVLSGFDGPAGAGYAELLACCPWNMLVSFFRPRKERPPSMHLETLHIAIIKKVCSSP